MAGAITGSGTSGNIAKFNGTGSITNSGLSESGSLLTYAGNLVANTAPAFTGNIINLQVNGSSKFSVNETGAVTAASTFNGAALSGGTLSGGNVSGGTLTSSAVNSLNVSGTAISGTGALTIDANGANTVSIGSISTGSVLLGGGVFSTGCTANNANGDFFCSGTVGGANVTASNGSGGYVGMITGSATASGYLQWSRPDGVTRIGYLGFNSGGANNLGLNLENSAAFQINGGNVSIGRGSTAPAYTLDVNGTLGVTGATTLGSTLAVTGNVTGGTYNSATISGGTLTSSAVNSLNVSGTAISGTGALAIDASGANTISLGGTSTGNILLGGGSASTGCTVTNSNGNLDCAGTIGFQTNFYGNGLNALQTSDTWLRLNNSGSFTSGTYTPGLFRADGGLQVTNASTFNVTSGGVLTVAGAATFGSTIVASGNIGGAVLFGTAGVIANIFAASQVAVGSDCSTAAAGICFGSASDTSLYRLAANWLYTPGALWAGGSINAAGGISATGNVTASVNLVGNALIVSNTIQVNTLGGGGSTICRNGSNIISNCASSQAYKHNIVEIDDTNLDRILGEISDTPIFNYQWNDGAAGVRTGVISEYLPANLTPTLDQDGNRLPDWFSVYGYLWGGEKAIVNKLNGYNNNFSTSQLNSTNISNTGTANFAGGLNASGQSTVENLNVTGAANFGGTLSVTGDTTLGGTLTVAGPATLAQLTVTGDATVEGTLTVDVIKVGNIEIAGHIITNGAVPASTIMAAAGSNALVNVDGNDTSGTITITTGATGVAAGDLTKIDFSKVFTKTPKVLLTGQDDNSVNARVYPKGKTLNDFMISTSQTLAPNTTYTFDYFIVE